MSSIAQVPAPPKPNGFDANGVYTDPTNAGTYTVREAAAILGVSSDLLYKQRREGKLHSVRVPGTKVVRFVRADIEAMVPSPAASSLSVAAGEGQGVPATTGTTATAGAPNPAGALAVLAKVLDGGGVDARTLRRLGRLFFDLADANDANDGERR